MTVEWSKTLLLWDPDDPKLFGLCPTDFENLGIETLEVSYDRIGKDPGVLSEIDAADAEALIFTRNDDMAGSPPIARLLHTLRMGYTTVSAIDAVDQQVQTRQCISDLLNGPCDIHIPEIAPLHQVSRNHRGTFSLIFDLEQLAGARFGMPRLLPMLESRGIRGTFFTTGFVAEIYPGLIERISRGGHEIAIHGVMHECLQGRALDEQVELIRRGARALHGYGPITGANYIFRMDRHSPEAMLRAGLTYLVLFRKALYHRTRFMEQSSRVRSLRTASGDLALVPVGVETYGMNRSMVKATIDNAWRSSIAEDVRHVSVLMHPFKDGSRERLKSTEWVIRYLTEHLGLTSVPVADVARTEPADSGAFQILYRWDENEPRAPSEARDECLTSAWWAPIIYHARRTERLCDGLNALGYPAVLSPDPQGSAKRICVCPDRWEDEARLVTVDPIISPRRAARATYEMVERYGCVEVCAASKVTEIWRLLIFHLPRTWADIREFIPRIAPKLLRILTGKEDEERDY